MPGNGSACSCGSNHRRPFASTDDGNVFTSGLRGGPRGATTCLSPYLSPYRWCSICPMQSLGPNGTLGGTHDTDFRASGMRYQVSPRPDSARESGCFMRAVLLFVPFPASRRPNGRSAPHEVAPRPYLADPRRAKTTAATRKTIEPMIITSQTIDTKTGESVRASSASTAVVPSRNVAAAKKSITSDRIVASSVWVSG